ncbi:hypothetical protein TSOC_004573 [Tetrabaena socialis]|uniref:Uncharacterized protein n=1 Tax=Tetrabaena socialis TaxID=47790 RepID=A0A2J8A8L4_9CHLO|nr:hypothetical protein TSOC_004573 [Tetrabaena socialis]|eukprot:PNH08850.1 hypothetical protein TSOC_004573 [Tetrabaena socialis]
MTGIRENRADLGGCRTLFGPNRQFPVGNGRVAHPSPRASRLDRILISTATLPSVLSWAIVAGHPADHRLVCASLAATPAASTPGPGLRRVRLHFLDFADLRERLRAWIETAVAAAPADPSALLDWWPAFKRSVSISACRLSQIARGRHVDAAAAEKAANLAADEAFAAVEEGDAAALPRAARARSAAAAAAVKATVGAARRTRHAWLRTGERPSPVITRQVRPPAACRLIPALRRPDGTSTADPSKMPGIMMAFWQRVCTAAATDPAARRVAAVEDTLGRVARLPLSTFGRAFAASGYALSRSLYHAEFAGLPTGPQLNRLRQTTTALVDRALSPAAYTANPHARLVGVGAACMPAPPALGGFGLLPLVEHVRGRHAALAARCLTGACPGLGSFQPPWALVALALLRHIHHAATPLCLLTARVLPAQGARRASVLVLGRPVPSTCPALIQLASAFSALPPPLILPSPALEPGPWCFNMPLWGNPFLPGATAGQSLEADFADLAGIRGFNTVGMAVRCCAAMTALLLTAPITPPGQPVNPAVARQLTQAYHATVLRGILQIEPAALPPALRSFPMALARFIALHPRMPPAWCAAAGVVANAPGGAAAAPAAPVVWSLLLRHLGWRLGTTVIPLLTLTVKQATTDARGPT